jgi:hypothetical protein
MSNRFHNLGAITMLLMFVTLQRPIMACCAFELLEIKLTTITKMSCAPFNIHRSNV